MGCSFEASCVCLQIECLLPRAKVTFIKFGERYCLSTNYHPRAYYGSKYDGKAIQTAMCCCASCCQCLISLGNIV